MGFLILSALALASPWTWSNPTGRWARPTAELAAELLPPEWASDAVAHNLGTPITQGGQPTGARFFGHGRETPDGFCVRNTYYVSIHTGLNGPEMGSPISRPEFRLGACEGIFARLNVGTPLDGGQKALRWLGWARATARSGSSLPFSLKCRDEVGESRCADARKALATLPLDKTYIISKLGPHRWELAVTETEPGQLLWAVKLDATPGQSVVDLAWKVPAPF